MTRGTKGDVVMAWCVDPSATCKNQSSTRTPHRPAQLFVASASTRQPRIRLVVSVADGIPCRRKAIGSSERVILNPKETTGVVDVNVTESGGGTVTWTSW